MVLETRRLILRDYKLQDLSHYFKLKSCNDIWNYSTFIPINTEDQAKEMLELLIDERKSGKYTFMALFEKETNEFLGEAGIISYNSYANRCEVGYNLLPKYWNKGYATEVTKALVKFAFDSLKVERIEALVILNNTPSCKVLEKSGMVLEGILRNFNRCESGYRNVCYYAMISSDYFKRD